MAKAPFSNEAFLDWLKRQPADATYRFVNSSECAITQYLRSLGFENARCTPRSWLDSRWPWPVAKRRRLPKLWNRAVGGAIRRRHFSEAAERLEKLMAWERWRTRAAA